LFFVVLVVATLSAQNVNSQQIKFAHSNCSKSVALRFEDALNNIPKKRNGASENKDLMKYLFFGVENATIMEIGAVDGIQASQSVIFERKFGWKRILVEANPTHKETLKSHKNAFTMSAAICSSPQTVHFVHNKRVFVTGIVEFMSPHFISEYHPEVARAMLTPGNLSSIDWASLPPTLVEKVSCLPLRDVLVLAKTTLIDVFILDIEGAEMSALQTLDWANIVFGVVIIEVGPPTMRPTHYSQTVQTFMASKGYICITKHLKDGQHGGNAWFRHESFTPSSCKCNALRMGPACDESPFS